MARGRLISRSLGSSRKFHDLLHLGGKLGEFCQVLFPLLIANTDDFGRLPGNAFTVKNVVLPSSRRTEADFERALQVITTVGLIQRYEVNGACYLQINQFDVHQPNLQKRGASVYPAPPNDDRLDMTERDVETRLVEALELGDLTICDFRVAHVTRQMRVGNCYLDIVAETEQGPVLLIEVKRQRVTHDALQQIRGYIPLLGEGRLVVPIVIGNGVAGNVDLAATDPVHVFEYDDDLRLTLRTSLPVLERSLTFQHVLATGARAESIPIQPRTEAKRSEVNPELRLERREADRLFAHFWASYPKKKAKEAAQKAWSKRSPDPELLSVMLSALERQKVSPDWQKDRGRYIPHPATWLNDARWTDVVEVDLAQGLVISDQTRSNLQAREQAMAKLKKASQV